MKYLPSGVLLSWTLAAAACSDDGSVRHTQQNGTAGATAAGPESAGGATCDNFDDLLAPSEVCRTVRACYPELQEVDTECATPKVDGIGYTFSERATWPNVAAVRACLCALPDQRRARAWVDCDLAAEHAAADCFNACALQNECGKTFASNAITSSVSCYEQQPDGHFAVLTCLHAE